jgi:polyhydroxybutyrate depolymerase
MIRLGLTQLAMTRLATTRLALLPLAMLVLASFVNAQSRVMAWTIDGAERQAIVYLPSAKEAGKESGKDANRPSPLILVFHGAGDSAENFQGINLHRAWPQAIVAYVQGALTDRGFPGFQTEKGRMEDRDLKLVDRMTATFQKDQHADPARTYAVGFSNGGRLVYLLWAERPNLFAGFASVAGIAAPSVHPQTPRPLLHIGGEADRQNAFELQKQSMEMARAANHTIATGKACGPQCMLYEPGSASPNAAPVQTIIHGGGHIWPDDASTRVALFLKSYALPPAAR